jgi:4-hydroxybenzoate polyprenyltransferase
MAAARGLISASHPAPILLVLLLTALTGLASADGSPDAGRLGVALTAMLLSQLSIGWSNDYLDRKTDALHQPWKPIPAGRLDSSWLPPLIVAGLAGAALAGAALGPAALLFLALGTVAGFSYNLGLKDTRFSALPFIAGLAALPPFVWSALDVYRGDFLFLYALGTPLALAAHIANTLPDLEIDRAAGRGGLVVTLGSGRSAGVLLACLVVAPLIAVLTAQGVRDVFAGALVAYVLLAAGAAMLYGAAYLRAAAVWRFRLVALSGVLLAAGWLTAV